MASHPRQSEALKTQHPPLNMQHTNTEIFFFLHFISVSCLWSPTLCSVFCSGPYHLLLLCAVFFIVVHLFLFCNSWKYTLVLCIKSQISGQILDRIPQLLESVFRQETITFIRLSAVQQEAHRAFSEIRGEQVGWGPESSGLLQADSWRAVCSELRTSKFVSLPEMRSVFCHSTD